MKTRIKTLAAFFSTDWMDERKSIRSFPCPTCSGGLRKPESMPRPLDMKQNRLLDGRRGKITTIYLLVSALHMWHDVFLQSSQFSMGVTRCVVIAQTGVNTFGGTRVGGLPQRKVPVQHLLHPFESSSSSSSSKLMINYDVGRICPVFLYVFVTLL